MAMNKKTLEEVRLDLAMNLKAIRAEKGLAQERLALDAGEDRTVVSKIERAKTNPSLDVLLRLANPTLTLLLIAFYRLTSPFKSQNLLGVGVR